MGLAAPFKEGDTVQLKSGGPVMTVATIQSGVYMGVEQHTVTCQWFDTSGVLKAGKFMSGQLVIERQEHYASASAEPYA